MNGKYFHHYKTLYRTGSSHFEKSCAPKADETNFKIIMNLCKSQEMQVSGHLHQVMCKRLHRTAMILTWHQIVNFEDVDSRLNNVQPGIFVRGQCQPADSPL